jgi:DNA-binding transcriptional regulator LsrR (DeoR family)
MNIKDESEGMGAQERAALALWLIMQRPQTTAAIARRLGMSHRAAWTMLARMSRRVPLTQNPPDWAWRIVKS